MLTNMLQKKLGATKEAIAQSANAQREPHGWEQDTQRPKRTTGISWSETSSGKRGKGMTENARSKYMREEMEATTAKR